MNTVYVSGQLHTTAPLPLGREPFPYPLDKTLGEPQSQPGRCEVENHLLPCRESNPGRAAGNPSLCVMSNLGCNNRYQWEIHELRDCEAAKKQRSHNASGYTFATLQCPCEHVPFRYETPGERMWRSPRLVGKSQRTGAWLSHASSRWGAEEAGSSSAPVSRDSTGVRASTQLQEPRMIGEFVATWPTLTSGLLLVYFIGRSSHQVIAYRYPSEITERISTKCSIGAIS
jgi:hypothetical protein